MNMIAISEFCSTGTGGTPSRQEHERYFNRGTIPWVKSGELRESIILHTEERVTQAALAETNLKVLPAGTLLIAMYGATVGRLGVLGVPATTNQAVCHIIPDPKRGDTRYLFHVLQSKLNELLSRRVGGAQPNISQGIVRSTRVPLPSLQDQRRIAAILDLAEVVRSKRSNAIEKLTALTRSFFRELFGDLMEDDGPWPVFPFESLVRETKLGLVRGSSEFGPGYEFPYIRMNAITRDGQMDFSTVQRTHATDAERREYSLRRGDFLFNTRNSRELVGKTTLFQRDDLHLFNNNLMRIRFKDHIIPEYVAAAFQRPLIQRELEARKSGTTSVFAIYWKELKTLPLPVPPVDLQRQFATQVAAVEQLKRKQEVSLTKLEALFASLQHRAFRGEL